MPSSVATTSSASSWREKTSPCAGTLVSMTLVTSPFHGLRTTTVPFMWAT
jgi:hypothetical protein